jgi:uncharacterized repeat protein (TIGR03803 family)
MRVLWAVLLVLPAFGASAGVVLTSLYSFQVFKDAEGANGLVQGSDGNLYGTTGTGGTNNSGSVFKISISVPLNTLYSFTGGKDGGDPQAGLAQGTDGNLYGTTSSGGTNGDGTVFKISTNGVLTSLFSFTGGSVGAGPQAALVQGSDGNFYGTTYSDGAYNAGTVFRMSTNGVLTKLHSFTRAIDGAGPGAALARGSDGNLYGTTWEGGTNDAGTVFKMNTNGALTSLYSFTGGDDGANPFGVVQGGDGNFYGTTEGGGTNGVGSVFKISTNGLLTSLHSFSGVNDGTSPEAALVRSSDGYLYGTTCGSYGGPDYGTVFKISTNGALTTLYSFTDGNDGALPTAALVQGNDGSFYGTTSSGGQGGGGTVFRLTVASAAPVLQVVTLTNTMVSLTWTTEAGGVYQLQFNSDLSSTNWTNLGGAGTAAGAMLSATDSVTNGPRRFYRVVLSP